MNLLREAPLGQILNWASGGRLLPYPEQRPGFVAPARYLVDDAERQGNINSGTPTLVEQEAVSRRELGGDLEKGAASDLETPRQNTYPYLVEWEESDSDNPLNWPAAKQHFMAFEICFLTFSIYAGSAIYTSSIPDLEATFGVSRVVATLGLSLFVVGYGTGPLFLSPLQEIPFLGRNPVYFVGLCLFVLFQLPVLLAPNFATILVFRFLAGFVGSAGIATGGASVMEIYSPAAAGNALPIWSTAAVLGPALAPVASGFAVQANGWRWSIYELLWVSGAALILISLALPETDGATILLRRAERLRKVTGNDKLKTQTELDSSANDTIFHHAVTNLKRAFQLCVEPGVLFVHLFMGLVYGVFYLWFEAFPIVFTDIHGFSLGSASLPFLSFVVAAIPTVSHYIWYNNRVFNPAMATDPDFQPEFRLALGFPAAFFIPVSLFIFGWGSRESVHWIVPVIGAGLYFPGLFDLFQVTFQYIALSYPPSVTASIFAGSALFRCTLAGVFPLIGHIFYDRLGLGGGCSLLAGLSILMIPLYFMLWKAGGRLRARSKWAKH